MAFDFLDVFSDRKLKILDQKIEQTISSSPQKITSISTKTSDSINSDIIDAFIADPEKNNTQYDQKGKDEVSMLLDKMVVPKERINRYKVYEEIYKSVPLIPRMMKVYVANILQKNPVTSKCIILRDSNTADKINKHDKDYEQNKEASRSFSEKALEHFDILNKLKYKILPNMVLYGDCFVEVVDVNEWKKDESTDLNKIEAETFIGESSIPSNYNNKTINDRTIIKNVLSKINSIKLSNGFNPSNIDDNIDSIINEVAPLFIDDPTESIMFIGEQQIEQQEGQYELNILEKQTDESTTYYKYHIQENGTPASTLQNFIKPETTQAQQPEWPEHVENKVNLDSIVLLTHHPSNVIILETDYGTKLGYVEVRDGKENHVNNIGQQLSSVIGKITAIGNKTAISQDIILNKLVKVIVKKIIEKSIPKGKLKGKSINNEKVLQNLSPEVYTFVKRLLIETSKNDPKKNLKKIQTRFIPIKRMFHFTMPSSEYTPYGASIVDPLVLHSKLYILSQLANVITKLSRAAVIRKWTLDVGPGQMHGSAIQKLKRELYNTRVTID